MHFHKPNKNIGKDEKISIEYAIAEQEYTGIL